MAVVRFHSAEAWLIMASICGRLLLLGAVRLPPNFTWDFLCVMVSMTPGGGGQFVDSSFFLSALICTDLRIAHHHDGESRLQLGRRILPVFGAAPTLPCLRQGQCMWLHCPHFLPLPGTPRFSRRSNRTVMCVWLQSVSIWSFNFCLHGVLTFTTTGRPPCREPDRGVWRFWLRLFWTLVWASDPNLVQMNRGKPKFCHRCNINRGLRGEHRLFLPPVPE